MTERSIMPRLVDDHQCLHVHLHGFDEIGNVICAECGVLLMDRTGARRDLF